MAERVLHEKKLEDLTKMYKQRLQAQQQQLQKLPTERVMQRDSRGNKWFQVVHYCSKHGYNHSHSNARCKDKDKPGWIPDASHDDPKGGATHNADKYQQWFNPYNKTYATKLP